MPAAAVYGIRMNVIQLADIRSAIEPEPNAWARHELSRFLRLWRARLKPADVGLPSHGIRRVSGLRREEVAELAGVSVTWYTAFELGSAPRISLRFASAIVEALRLDRAERTFLFALLGTPLVCASSGHGDALEAVVEPGDSTACALLNGDLGVVSTNAAFRRLFGTGSGHFVEGLFRDAALRGTFIDWDDAARFGTGALRMQLARGRDGARRIYEALRRDPVFEEHWEAGALYDPADARLALRIRDPQSDTMSVHIDAIGIGGWGLLMVVSGADDCAKQRLRRLTAA